MKSLEDAGLGCGTLGSGLVREQVGVSAAPGVMGDLRQGEAKNEDGILGWGGAWAQEQRLTGNCPVSHRAELNGSMRSVRPKG